jgi:hypothetical protein
MLGRKSYTREEIEGGRAAIGQQMAAYDELARAFGDGAGDPRAGAAVEAFAALFFNNMALVLDRYFVHRLPGAAHEGKDGNPLNEVRILCDSLMNSNGVVRADKQIKLSPERSVLKLAVGDSIRLTSADFARLSAAFFDELERRFGEDATARTR